MLPLSATNIAVLCSQDLVALVAMALALVVMVLDIVAMVLALVAMVLALVAMVLDIVDLAIVHMEGCTVGVEDLDSVECTETRVHSSCDRQRYIHTYVHTYMFSFPIIMPAGSQRICQI